ncbi:Endonuclease III (DNA-(apurinic or apyrimidinic site) lyase) [Durusdinium trenchii]
MTRKNAHALFERLSTADPTPQTELYYKNPFTLVVAVALSAQATDEGVNKATKTLFEIANTPQQMAALGEKKLGGYIKTIGLWRNKAKNVIALSQKLIDDFDGEVPQTREALETLPGVGRKTANVVMNVAFGAPTIAVDTHIFRIGNRTGLAPGKNPLEVELGLEKITPPEFLHDAHHWLILHGRYVCKAEAITDAVGDAGAFYKIGYQLMPLGGLQLAERLSATGKKVFLDFKFHDIGATVERGVKSVTQLGGDFLTVHAELDVLKGAVAGRGSDKRLKILGVTVLTSLNQDSLTKAGIDMKLEDLVLKRAEFAAEAGADGVVASAKEAAAIKARFADALTIVTPGVRPKGASADDQKRVVTPAEAIMTGADHIVVGRPIIAANDPHSAAKAIQRDLANAS